MMTANFDDLISVIVGNTGQPWALDQRLAHAVTALIADHTAGESISPARLSAAFSLYPTAHQSMEATLSASRGSRPHIQIVPGQDGDTAIIPLHGIATFGLSLPPFAFSTRLLASQVQELTADSSVKKIVLNISSPGGIVYGTPEAAAAIYQARQQKPIMAAVSPFAASAAYWIASQCTSIVATSSADVGSIGVFMLHVSYARALEKAGIEPTYIFAGGRKVDGNSHEPLSKRAREDYQNAVDETYMNFLDDVARGRQTARVFVQRRYGEGRLLNTKDALAAGMIDRVANDPVNYLIASRFPSGDARAGLVTIDDQSRSKSARRHRRLLEMKR